MTHQQTALNKKDRSPLLEIHNLQRQVMKSLNKKDRSPPFYCVPILSRTENIEQALSKIKLRFYKDDKISTNKKTHNPPRG